MNKRQKRKTANKQYRGLWNGYYWFGGQKYQWNGHAWAEPGSSTDPKMGEAMRAIAKRHKQEDDGVMLIYKAIHQSKIYSHNRKEKRMRIDLDTTIAYSQMYRRLIKKLGVRGAAIHTLRGTA